MFKVQPVHPETIGMKDFQTTASPNVFVTTSDEVLLVSDLDNALFIEKVPPTISNQQKESLPGTVPAAHVPGQKSILP